MALDLNTGSIKFNVRGSDALRRNIQTMRLLFPHEVDRALKEEAQDLLNDARDNHVPVDMGDLKRSGKVEFIQRGTGHYAGVKFGGTEETEAYAIAVHEHMSIYSPPSWAGKTPAQIKWTIPGTGVKYLEIPFQKSQAGFTARVAARITKFISSMSTIP